VLVLAPLVALLVTVLAMKLRPGEILPEDPDLALNQIEASLANGEKVELIGQTGAPKWYRNVVSNHTRTSLAKDGAFTIDPWDDDLALVELVRDPHRQNYTITAQVRQEDSDQLGEVGIYCCRYEYLARRRTAANMFIYLAYSDADDAVARYKRNPTRLKPVSGNPATFTFYWYSQGQGKLIADDIVDDHTMKNVFKAAGPNAMRWRTLALKVAPDRIEGNWEKATNVGKILTAGLVAQADKSLRAKGVGGPDDPTLQQLYPGFPQQGGIGLFVRRSSASFCNVTIEY
jgi:serine/threonine-protein kinase